MSFSHKKLPKNTVGPSYNHIETQHWVGICKDNYDPKPPSTIPLLVTISLKSSNSLYSG